MRQRGFSSILAVILILIAASGVYFFWVNKSNVLPTPVQTQFSTTSIKSTPPFPPVSNWKTYSDSKTGVTFKYDKYYFVTAKWPEKFDAFKEAPIIFTGNPNYNTGSLIRCDMNNLPLQNLCILPGENFKQSDYITGTEIAGRPARLFYINTGEPTNNVLQVVQTTGTPIIEIAIPIDGTRGQEIADQILSTLKFTR